MTIGRGGLTNFRSLAILAILSVLSAHLDAYGMGKIDTSPASPHSLLQITLWLLFGAFGISYSSLFWFSDRFAKWEFYRYSDRNAGLRLLAGGDLTRGLWIGRWIFCPFFCCGGLYMFYVGLSWCGILPGI